MYFLTSENRLDFRHTETFLSDIPMTENLILIWQLCDLEHTVSCKHFRVKLTNVKNITTFRTKISRSFY